MGKCSDMVGEVISSVVVLRSSIIVEGETSLVMVETCNSTGEEVIW